MCYKTDENIATSGADISKSIQLTEFLISLLVDILLWNEGAGSVSPSLSEESSGDVILLWSSLHVFHPDAIL
jgi:hypothetical protein